MSLTKILLVDDEKLLQSIIQQKFKKAIQNKELEFLFALNGEEALEIVNAHVEIQIILLDLNMPFMNGITLLYKLLQLNRVFRVVVLTAYGDMANIRQAMKAGASDFITKPIDLDDLERTIKRNIEKCKNLNLIAQDHDKLLELSKELELAKKIQLSLIPTQFTEFGPNHSLEIYGEVIPSPNMGGDFFDFFKLNQHSVGFFIGEVAASGIPAALFMTITRSLLHTFGLKNASPRVCFENINKLLLVKEIAFAIFATAFFGIIDLRNGKVTYCNAGHRPLFVLSKGNGLKEIGRYEGIPLAITDDPASLKVKFEEKQFQILPGDTMLLYTNGFLEVQNDAGAMYGEGRFKKFLEKVEDFSPEQVVKNLKKDSSLFSQNVHQINDMTLFSLQYKGNHE